MLTYFQAHHTFLEYNQGHQTWDEVSRSIGERTCGTRSAIWKGLGREAGWYINPSRLLLLLFRIQNDALSWLAEVSKGREHTLEEITLIILIINYAAIHTTTMARKFIFTDKDFSHSLSDRYTFAIQLGSLS